jgi:His-Xaa-Ser system radical SAM maturase HxsC
MCSQPPRPGDEAWILDELGEVIPLISPATMEIGITGGEPTLLGRGLFDLLDRLHCHLPRTSLHLLSNGRRFCDLDFARQLADTRHHDLVVGIPLYSDLPEEHDYVVQVRGAFSETVRGVVNLKRLRQRVEVRFVIHKQNFQRLPDFARFMARNLLFIDHVALMSLEIVGAAQTNIEHLWVDPLDYQDSLRRAVDILTRAGMAVSIYGHQLCVLDARLGQFSRKAISDWKNLYFEECLGCAKRSECGGFFESSTLRRSRGIRSLSEGTHIC